MIITASEMELSIIIINFNTNQLTIECINSIQSHVKGILYEIILVDNAPDNGENRVFFQGQFPELIYIFSESNLGFGRANNIGIRKAKGRYLLLLNSDTLIADDCLQTCLAYMDKPESAKIGLLGCKLLNSDGSYQPSFFPFTRNTLWNYLISNNPLFYKIFKIGELYKETDQIRMVGDVSGAFMLLRREVVRKAGAFDPDFFLFCEETEWCRERISKICNIVYYPLASIIHYGGKSAPQESMIIQSKLSLALLWYKKGLFSYSGYIILTIFNLLTGIFAYPFVETASKLSIRMEVCSFIYLIPYMLFKVPGYGRSGDIKNKPLIYDGARSIFFKKAKKRA